MDEEFKLCWKNFQDNIASGFQNLYDRGDLVDVTLACDGKLLHAHKIVLAICSPYFQEIFITNPCKHPIIILKDVTFNIMCELLEFMYQGVVNVKHTELQSFMKIGQLLQIKGLATNASAAATSSAVDKSASQVHNIDETSSTGADAENNSDATEKQTEPNRSNPNHGEDMNATDGLSSVKLTNPISVKSHSPVSSPSPMGFGSSSTLNQQQNFKSSPDSNMPLHQTLHTGAAASLKRHHADINNDALSIYSRKQYRRSIVSAEHNATTDHSDSADADADSDYFLSSIPHLATSSTAAAAAAAFRNSFNPAAFGFDYNLYKSGGVGGGMGGGGVGGGGIGGAVGNNTSGGGGGGMEYPNDLHIPSEYKNFANHVDIPPNSSSVVMLSSTSLLHGNCVFNRNNTVATQQGMKTYWLCKSYRISMCRARCITHQGRVISATGVHNHPPHMRSNGGPGGGSGNGGVGSSLGCGSAGGGGGGVGFPIDNTIQQTSASAPTSISPTMNLNSINMSNVLLPGGSNGAVGSGIANSGIRLHHHTSASGGTMSGGGSMFQQQHHNNSPGQQLQLHHQQQQQQLQLQQQQLDSSTPPPPPQSSQMSASLLGGGNSAHAHAHTHSAQSTTTSPFMSHHSSGGDGSSFHHPHHTLGGGGAGSSSVPSSGSSQGLHSNSVIHNLLQNATSANAMHHHHHHHHSQQQHISHHLSQHAHTHEQSPHHHHQQHQPHLEITPLIHSPPLQPPSSSSLHLESPTNHSNQSQHGSCNANSLSSPITTQTTTASAAATGASSNGALKSAAQRSLSDESTTVACGGVPSETQSHCAHSTSLTEHQQQQQHHILSHHGATTLSPSDMNSNTPAISTHSTTDGGRTSDRHQNQAHVIDSITISTNEEHHFKIEDM
ncbi:broad-complex core protein isoforms 1/2/3/4/5 [Eurosta solidaginis]|uniref:broad-complex core protein isoforms 1/2/3/4/5 n=1 Tax=Eurosta solidaginis TaxID=178769 RepID=UPI0035305B97